MKLDHGTVYIQPKKLFSKLYYTKLGALPEVNENDTKPKVLKKPEPAKAETPETHPMALLIIVTLTILTIILPLVFIKVKKLTTPRVSYPSAIYEADLNGELKDKFFEKIPEADKAEAEKDLEFIQTIIESVKSRSTIDSKKLSLAIVLESKRANIDPLLVTAIINQESGFKIHARSPVGARGLMQIMPATARYINKVQDIDWPVERDLNNPVYNIRLGIVYIKYLERKYRKDMDKVLWAYNWGPGNVNKYLSRQIKYVPKGVVRYSRNVQSTYRVWLRKIATEA